MFLRVGDSESMVLHPKQKKLLVTPCCDVKVEPGRNPRVQRSSPSLVLACRAGVVAVRKARQPKLLPA